MTFADESPPTITLETKYFGQVRILPPRARMGRLFKPFIASAQRVRTTLQKMFTSPPSPELRDACVDLS